MVKKQRFTIFENCSHEAQLPDYVLINIMKKAFKNAKKMNVWKSAIFK